MEMNTILLILVAIGVLTALVLIMKDRLTGKEAVKSDDFLLQQIQAMREEIQRTTNDHRKDVQDQLNRVQDQLGRGMQHSQTSMQKQFEQTTGIIQTITEKLVTLDSTNKQVLDFSHQLQDLQKILKNPKQRGVLGEYWLETLLANVMPNRELYAMQHYIGDDDNGQKLIADAVVFVAEHIIPIDAKFSLENYNRIMEESDPERRAQLEKQFKTDVKHRIDETSKYIRPEYNTLAFAFMFIPAEGVYYNLLNAEVGSGINSNSLVEYAFKKRVMIVSPTSFYAYLQTVLMGLNKLEIEKSTQEIIKRVGELKQHMNSYQEYHEKLGKNISTVVNHYNRTSGELVKMSKDVQRVTLGQRDEIIELDTIEKPILE